MAIEASDSMTDKPMDPAEWAKGGLLQNRVS